MGTMKGLILIGCETLRVVRHAFLEKEVFHFLHKLRLEQGRVPKGRVPKFLASRFPHMWLKEGHLGFAPKQAGISHRI